MIWSCSMIRTISYFSLHTWSLRKYIMRFPNNIWRRRLFTKIHFGGNGNRMFFLFFWKGSYPPQPNTRRHVFGTTRWVPKLWLHADWSCPFRSVAEDCLGQIIVSHNDDDYWRAVVRLRGPPRVAVEPRSYHPPPIL